MNYWEILSRAITQSYYNRKSLWMEVTRQQRDKRTVQEYMRDNEDLNNIL